MDEIGSTLTATATVDQGVKNARTKAVKVLCWNQPTRIKRARKPMIASAIVAKDSTRFLFDSN